MVLTLGSDGPLCGAALVVLALSIQVRALRALRLQQARRPLILGAILQGLALLAIFAPLAGDAWWDALHAYCKCFRIPPDQGPTTDPWLAALPSLVLAPLGASLWLRALSTSPPPGPPRCSRP